MIDFELHAHTFMDGADYKGCVLIHSKKPNEEVVRTHLSAYQNANIHFIRDGGDHYGVCTLAKRLAVEYGIEYITPVFAIHKKDNYGSVVGKAFTDLREYEILVKEAQANGADFIKIMLSGIVDFDNYKTITKGEYTQAEANEMVNIAHGQGLSVMAHVNGSQNVKQAIIAGVDSIEHGYFIDEETVEMLSVTEIVWVPTLVTSKNLLRFNRNNTEVVLKTVTDHETSIQSAFEKGALIGLGSDAGAFGVFHAKGTFDEYEALKCILDETKLDNMLNYTAQLVKRKFINPYK